MLTPLVNSEVTGPHLTKFIPNVEKLLPLNLLKSKSRYSKTSRNVGATNKGESANFSDFASKIAFHGNVP